MNTSLDDSLKAHLRQQLMGLVLPSGRFFTPTDKFFSVLKEFTATSYIDAGCGNGMLTVEAAEHGIVMRGIDLARRPDTVHGVMQLDATSTFLYSTTCWPVICRPSHDGFCCDTIKWALSLGANALYVGLERNVERDLRDFYSESLPKWDEVGEDGECLWLIED